MIVLSKDDAVYIAEEYTKLIMLALQLETALAWCGGSADFAPEGTAHEGWKRVVAPTLANFRAYKKEKESHADADC